MKRGMVFGFLVLVVIGLVPGVLAEDVNLCLDVESTLVLRGGSHVEDYSSVSLRAHDDIVGNYIGGWTWSDGGYDGSGSDGSLRYTWNLSFPEAVNIEYLENLRQEQLSYRLYTNTGYVRANTSLWYGGRWNSVDIDESVAGSSTALLRTIHGSWNEVEKIKVEVDVFAPAVSNYYYENIYKIYEFRAFGVPSVSPYQDSGLRIRVGGDTIKIAARMNEANSVLKIRNNEVTYGIALVAKNDPAGSGVRVSIDGITYELRKFE